MFQDVPPEVKEQVPGAMGSLAALLWLRDTWPRRIGYFAAGAVLSKYASPYAVRYFQDSGYRLDAGFAGFLMGLFGIAICAKVFEAIEAINVKGVVSKIFKKVGL